MLCEVIGSPFENLPKSDGGPTNIAECGAITAFFRTEIERIINQLSEAYSP